MYRQKKWLFFLIVYLFSVHWLYFGTLDDSESRFWSGAIAWGPRYFVPILPFITIALGTLLVRFKQSKLLLKSSLLILCAAGFIINLPGVLVWSEYGTIYAWDREQLNRFPDSLEVIAWNPGYSPIVLHAKILIEDYVHKIHADQYTNTKWHYITYGLAPCSYDLYVFCKFGIFPIVVLMVVAIILAMKITNKSISKSLQGIKSSVNLRI
jgi:hypothetical protein